MIVGLPAYLVTDTPLTAVYTEETAFGSVRIVARSHFTVDWGDDTTTGPHHTAGDPYPKGTIAHNYSHSGDYDIVVIQHWTATWSIGDETGDLGERTTSGRIDDFPVDQIQAVRND